MAENSENHQESLFKPNKRRKVFRKRAADDDEGLEEGRSGKPEFDESSGDVNAVQEDSNEFPSVVRRPTAKKHGINFSSSNATNHGGPDPDESTESTALVPLVEKEAGNALQHDRFTKPTGKVGVVEDRHLTAYVDSKLAELRSSSATPIPHGGGPVAPAGGVDDELSSQATDTTGLEAATGTEAVPTKGNVEALRRGHPYGSRNKRRRRQPYVRDASDIARDAMVDAIMSESQVPLYDQPSTAATTNIASSEIDQDEAAAEAFKAQFLVEMEQRRRRKPPAPPAPGQAPSGPKLGGSRSQREKMRAMEEAKNAAGKK